LSSSQYKGNMDEGLELDINSCCKSKAISDGLRMACDDLESPASRAVTHICRHLTGQIIARMSYPRYRQDDGSKHCGVCPTQVSLSAFPNLQASVALAWSPCLAGRVRMTYYTIKLLFLIHELGLPLLTRHLGDESHAGRSGALIGKRSEVSVTVCSSCLPNRMA
jgi:hypothetical protein